MTNVIKKATNRWTKGLIMDFSPENTKNTVLTHALNATLLTFNGNEMSLQNDMGNARVETAYLPEGYIPVGACEYGGIIYIVSYNPLEDKSQIGCFPSPERNVSSNELGMASQKMDLLDFQKTTDNTINGTLTGDIKNVSKYVLLKNDKLNPGDKFIVYANEKISEESIAGLEKLNDTVFEKVTDDPIIALNIVSIEDSGKITYLNNDVINYEYEYTDSQNITNTYKYHILGKSSTGSNNTLDSPDIDAYRNVLSSGYSVFKSKTSGKLAILAELLSIDSYSVTHRVEEVKDSNNNVIKDNYNIIIYPEISCDETSKKYGVTPKLNYYFLKESQGFLQLNPGSRTNPEDDTNLMLRPLFHKDYDQKNYTILNTPLQDIIDISGLPLDYLGSNLKYIYEQHYNNINPFKFYNNNTYHANIIDNGVYNNIQLGTIVLPKQQLLKDIGCEIQLPFKYSYTLVPCMSYGKLENLAVSNTINFMNLHDFNASSFNVWKYRVDGPTVHLQFGAEIYDTNVDPVTALVLEFYDLWGFAGSLTIDNKKAYSGIFTKILTLNAINYLGKQKVPDIPTVGNQVVGKYTNEYQRNIKIVQEWDNASNTKHYLNDCEIQLVDQEKGWRQYNNTTGLYDLDIENDCGTLYPNIIYGVKAYFVQDDPNSDQKIFTFKDQFFMFTTPLFNNYYYTVNNFNTLKNPELDFVLTSRIKDSSIKESLVYNDGSLVIENGYKSGSKIEEYVKGSSAETTIHDTKYYKYKGTSELQLEIGLKKDYNDIGLMYDRNINKYFGCTLELVNNDNNGTWSVESDSGITDQHSLLNYSENNLKNDSNLNSLSFSGKDTIVIPINTFQDYHFLDPNNQSGKYIPISYEFVVGYAVTIDNIRQTQIPATTVCALCHKRDDGIYNYEDFGIEEGIDSDGNPIYFSSTIFYNSGTNTDVHFGLCRQISTSGNALTQCSKIDSSNYDTVKIQTPRILNAGDPLKDMLPYIGKLSFCEPHLSGFSESDGVNISPYNGSLYINPDLSTSVSDQNKHNKTYGIVPSNELYKNPQYLLCANTKNMISRQSEFVVNMQREPKANINGIYIGYENDTPQTFNTSVSALQFIGLTGQQLTDYNKKLLETMKCVYAYNPDYNSLTVKAGDVYILDNKVRFTSNVICKDATIDFSSDNTSLNDFVSIGNMSFSNYFNNLNLHSNIVTKVNNQWVDQINFIPNIDYCGGKTNRALLRTITYNTPDISDLYDELTFSNDNIIIRHENGDISYIRGDLNPKMLYGFRQDSNQLIQLDVNNYEINKSDGTVSLKLEQKYSQDITVLNNSSVQESYNIPVSFVEGETNCNVSIGISPQNCICKNDGFFTLVDGSIDVSCIITPENSNDGYEYTVEGKISFKTGTRQLLANNPTTCDSTEWQTYDGADAISSLINGESYTQNLDISSNTTFIVSATIESSTGETAGSEIAQPSDSYVLVQVVPEHISIKVTRSKNTESFTESIINFIPTINYYGYKYSYQILSQYTNTVLCGTNITLNDLVYEPNVDGHRLYMRPNCFKYFGDPRARLYYRTLTPDENSNISTTWKGDTDYYNMLFINTGPCFIPDNLS